MDAAAAVLKEADFDALAGQLESLTHNQANFLQPGDVALKLRHTNKDRPVFDQVMEAEPPVDHAGLKHTGSKVVQAHQHVPLPFDAGSAGHEGSAATRHQNRDCE